MAFNLANLKISLDKFNAESSGTYNIGQIKLSSDGKSVYRTNSHKTWTILNRTKMSSEEALAVKFAFCKALKKEGLQETEINEVKAKLGIPGNALDALKTGNIKPLTAAEVREIIDQYADKINQKRASTSKKAAGVTALKTSNDLYRGVSKRELEDRATTRNVINSNSMAKMMTGADRTITNLLDILQFGQNGGNITSKKKKLANEIMVKLGNPKAFEGKNGKEQAVKKAQTVEIVTVPMWFELQRNGNITAKLKLNNGNTFSIDTGLDRNGLVDKAISVLNWVVDEEARAEKLRNEEKFSDDEIMNAINEIETGEIKKQSDKFVMSTQQLLSGLSKTFTALEKAKPNERQAMRNANMEDVVKVLQQALDRVRHLDNRNTKLINDVREVFYGNKNINSDNLLKEISDVLNKKYVNPMDKTDQNIQNHIVDDLDENLNINDWLNQ